VNDLEVEGHSLYVTVSDPEHPFSLCSASYTSADNVALPACAAASRPAAERRTAIDRYLVLATANPP